MVLMGSTIRLKIENFLICKLVNNTKNINLFLDVWSGTIMIMILKDGTVNRNKILKHFTDVVNL